MLLRAQRLAITAQQLGDKRAVLLEQGVRGEHGLIVRPPRTPGNPPTGTPAAASRSRGPAVRPPPAAAFGGVQKARILLPVEPLPEQLLPRRRERTRERHRDDPTVERLETGTKLPQLVHSQRVPKVMGACVYCTYEGIVTLGVRGAGIVASTPSCAPEVGATVVEQGADPGNTGR